MSFRVQVRPFLGEEAIMRPNVDEFDRERLRLRNPLRFVAGSPRAGTGNKTANPMFKQRTASYNLLTADCNSSVHVGSPALVLWRWLGRLQVCLLLVTAVSTSTAGPDPVALAGRLPVCELGSGGISHRDRSRACVYSQGLHRPPRVSMQRQLSSTISCA